jgi:Carboxypeptidase regulatory-like domain/TonB-dependent Receptor Plug Domain
MKSAGLAILVLLTLAAAAAAQVTVGGNIEGTITDPQNIAVPGATVTAQGPDATLTFVTGADGKFRFLRLGPGTYKVSASLQGFSTLVRDNVVVVVGQTVDLPIQLKVATVAETVTVTGASPVVDTKATGTSTNVTAAELAAIPTSRDPWALLRTVPGVMVDRVNVGGNETGQQSGFQSKGTRPADAVWTMDGVVITDMAAIGSSPTYFNYSNFEEIQISTSGQDIRQPTGGVGLNFIVKSGTNRFKAAGRYFWDGSGVESTNIPSELSGRTLPALPVTASCDPPGIGLPATCAAPDHNSDIKDYGFEGGGPIVKDKAWFFASWADQDVRLVRTAGNLIDRTVLKTTNAKGNWQATKNDMVSVLWFVNAKEKYGRGTADAGILFETPTATWDQGNYYVPGKPRGLLKFEDNHTFGSSFYVSGRYAYYDAGFILAPKGGLETNAGRSLVTASSYGSTRQSTNLRPQNTVSVDANTFHTWGGSSHEIKFGWSWRKTEATTGTLYPGNMVLALQNTLTDTRARVYREGLGTNVTKYNAFYVGDSIALGRTTVDVGVRYDRQWGGALPSNIQANNAFPSLVPGVAFAGYDAPFTWNNVSPRVGVTYALDAAHKTILRANYSRYAGQLETGLVGYTNPASNAGYAEYPWTDLNGDHLATANEVNTSGAPLAFGGGFNPLNPTAVTSASVIDPNFKAPITQSAVIGVDRELMPNLGLQVNYSFTRTTDWYWEPWHSASGSYLTAADYQLGPVLSGTFPTTIGGVAGYVPTPASGSYSVQTYIPDSAKVAAGGNGQFLSNYPGYRSQYNGIELQLTKRMSNRWMARVGTAYNNATEYYDVAQDYFGNPTPRDTEPLVNGGAFVVRSAGSGAGDIFIHGKWQFNANGAYDLGHDFQVSGNLFGRQGYPIPIYRSQALGADSALRVLVSQGLDTYRLPSLWDLDLRVSKALKFSRGHVTLMADLFNVFNSNTELVRNRNVLGTGQTGFYGLAQNLSPRIARFGIDIGF